MTDPASAVTPAPPSAPETPSAPSAPETASAPGAPETPSAPGAPETASAPGGAGPGPGAGSGLTGRPVRVWDRLIRTGHWLLLVAVATGLITRGEPQPVHLGAGYVVLAWIVARLFWGVAGPPNARFGQFVTSPGAAIGYLADLVRGRARRRTGHSPAGGWMVVALMLALSGTVASGLAMESRPALAAQPAVPAGVLTGDPGPGSGPQPAGPALAGPAHWGGGAGAEPGEDGGDDGDDGDGRTGGGPLEELHELFANLVLGLVILHVLGVAAASLAHRENLVRAMIDGHKRAGP